MRRKQEMHHDSHRSPAIAQPIAALMQSILAQLLQNETIHQMLLLLRN